MSKIKFQNLTGMHDILPEDQVYFQKVQKSVENIANYYSFQKIETPILEQAEVFSKAVGTSTDIVGKEMYTFRTKGGDLVSLRPEGTASIMRSYIEHGMHNLPQPVKFWYIGPFFRYERPQTGRFRQFHQFGFEALGEKNPSIDCQRRLKENPLRILDCKEEKCQTVKASAPQIIDHLCKDCHAHFKQVLEFLDELELPYTLNPYLVRGLDYYTKTV